MNRQRLAIVALLCLLGSSIQCTNQLVSPVQPEIDEVNPATIDLLNSIFDELESTRGRLVCNYHFFKDKPLTLPRDHRSRKYQRYFTAIQGPMVGLYERGDDKSYILYYYGAREENGSLTNDSLSPQAPQQFILLSKDDGEKFDSQFCNSYSLCKFLEAHPSIRVQGGIKSKFNSFLHSKALGLLGILAGAGTSALFVWAALKHDPELFKGLGLSILLMVAGVEGLTASCENFSAAYNGFKEAFSALKKAQEETAEEESA